MTKEKSTIIYLDLKQKATLILSHHGSFKQSNKYQTLSCKNIKMLTSECDQKLMNFAFPNRLPSAYIHLYQTRSRISFNSRQKKCIKVAAST